ncbi:MAG: M13 family metallopeptidase [Thermoanaerobaculia bacterium]
MIRRERFSVGAIPTGALFFALALPAFAAGPPPAPAAGAQPTKAPAGNDRSERVEGIEGIDRTVDPCTDFYEFADGTWRAENPIPEGMSKWSRRSAARGLNRQRVRSLLEELSMRAGSPSRSAVQKAGQLAGDYFASCMNEAAIDAAGLAPLAPWLADIENARDLASVEALIRRLHEIAVPVPFGTTVVPDYNNPSRVLVNVVAGGLGLPGREFYLSDEPHFVEVRERYRSHVARVLTAGGTPAARAESAAGEILALEKRLAAASLDSDSAADPAKTDHLSTIADLGRMAPHFDWTSYFDESRLRPAAGAGTNEASGSASDRDAVNVAEPKFVEHLEKEFRDTPLLTWKSYLAWHLLNSASPWLASPFADEAFDFREKYLNGAVAKKPRAETCLDATEALLGEEVGREYAERYFPPAAKAKAQEIARNLQAALAERLAGLTWQDPATKSLALAKVAALDLQIGYPDHWRDDARLVLRRDALWANIVQLRRAQVDDERRQLGRTTDRDLWALPPSSPGAYIDFQLNKIVLPAGFLQPPYFDLAATDAANYGALGVGLAHDLTHTIDTLGVEVDLQGRPRNWWTPADRAAFESRGACFVEQFETYSIAPGEPLLGTPIRGEVIAELAGLEVAYRALEKALAVHPGPARDGFTPEQQFFISWAQSAGVSMGLDAQRQFVKNDPHPVARFRVIGTLANSPEFQPTFACKPGSAMVRPPEKRCALW